MPMDGTHHYPDIADILARKARGRRARARLSFGEKLEILDRMREDAAPIVAAREARVRQAARRVSSVDALTGDDAIANAKVPEASDVIEQPPTPAPSDSR